MSDPYRRAERLYQKEVDDCAAYEASIERIADEIMLDTELLEEAMGEFDGLRLELLGACVKCLDWHVRNDQETLQKTVREIAHIARQLAWEYAPMLKEMRAKHAAEY